MRSDVARSLTLCILSLIGYGLTFAIQVVLARNLDTSNFHDYNVAVAVLFAPAPYLLQFIGQSRLVVITSTVTCLTTVVMSVLLVDHWGTVGVAFAYAAPLGAQFIFMKSMLHRWLPESQSTPAT